MKRAHVYLLGAYSFLTLFSFILGGNWRLSGFLIRCSGAIAGAIFCTYAATPEKWKTEQQQIAALLVKEREYLEQEKEQLRQSAIADSEMLAEQIKIAEERLNQEREFAIAAIEEERKRLLEEWELERQTYESAITQLNYQLIEANVIKRPKGTSRVEWVADQIIDVFIEYEVAADYRDSYDLPGLDYIWVVPRSQVKVKKLKELSEEIQLRLHLNNVPEINVVDGAIEICIKADQEKTQRRLAAAKNVVEPDFDFMDEAVERSHHFRVNGQTDAGKSTFVNNLIVLAQKKLGPKTKIVLIDPKYPLSDWDIEPHYKGIQEALDGLIEMADEIERRLDLAREAKETGKIIPEFNPILYVIDEIDWVISEYESEASRLLKVGLKVGRALKVKVCYLGQSPMCIDLKFKKTDFSNSSNFFLGENALKGVEEVSLTNSQRKNLLSQIYARQEAALTDESHRFFALIKFPGKPAFTAKLPKPNQYAEQAIATSPVPLVNENERSRPIEDLVEDAKKIEQIRQGWQSENDLTTILAAVFPNLSDDEARAEYRRLMGE